MSSWPLADDARSRVPPSPHVDNRDLQELTPIAASEAVQEAFEKAKMITKIRQIRSEAQFQQILGDADPCLRIPLERHMRPYLAFPGANTSIEGL